MTGEYDFLVKVVARDTPDLLRITNAVLTIDGVVRTNTAISLVEAMPMRIRPLLEAAADGLTRTPPHPPCATSNGRRVRDDNVAHVR